MKEDKIQIPTAAISVTVWTCCWYCGKFVTSHPGPKGERYAIENYIYVEVCPCQSQKRGE